MYYNIKINTRWQKYCNNTGNNENVLQLILQYLFLCKRLTVAHNDKVEQVVICTMHKTDRTARWQPYDIKANALTYMLKITIKIP